MTSLEINFFFLRRIHVLLSKDQKNKFPHYFYCTVLVSISLSDKNIKYSKSNSKSIRLRVTLLKNSNFLLNGNQHCHAILLEL